MESRFKIDLLVGIFVFGSIVIFCLFLLQVSDTVGLFEDKVTITTSYANAAVADGTTVRFQGTKAGTVVSVKLPKPLAKGTKDAELKSKAIVTMEIRASILKNIGKDATAKITTEGMLGDNLIYITRGTPESVGHLQDGDFIPGEEGAGMLDALAPVADTLDQILSDLHDDLGEHGKYKTSIGEMMGNIRDITGDINSGTGTLGALINDPAGKDVAKNVEELTGNLADITGELHAHGFEKELTTTIKNAGDMAKNLADITGELHEKDIESDLKAFLENVDEMTESLASVLKKIDMGEGTIGAFINDRKMYEDISSLLQGANRSAVVKTAVRHVWNEKLRDAEKERQRRAEEIKSQ